MRELSGFFRLEPWFPGLLLTPVWWARLMVEVARILETAGWKIPETGSVNRALASGPASIPLWYQEQAQ